MKAENNMTGATQTENKPRDNDPPENPPIENNKKSPKEETSLSKEMLLMENRLKESLRQ